MKSGKKIEILIKYLPFLLLVLMLVLTIYISKVIISEEAERNIQIWTNGLRLVITIGIIENLIFQDIRAHLEFGNKAPNLVNVFIENDSEENSVLFNDLCVIMFLGTLTMFVGIIYMHTKIQVFFICSIFFSMLCLVGVGINMLAFYIRMLREDQQRDLPQILNPELLSLIIELILIFVTSKSTVGIVYEYLYEIEDTIQTILVIVVVLCYVSALIFCHFSNAYCLIAVSFINKDSKRIEEKIDNVMRKNKKREDVLRQETKYVNEKAEIVWGLKKCKLAFYYLYCLMRSYCQSRKYDIEYIYFFINFKVVGLLGGLLEETSFKINSIRFCEIMIVVELLIVDMFLFVYLGSNAVCSRFFELLSTVIIIPILLSSLTSLKSSKRKR